MRQRLLDVVEKNSAKAFKIMLLKKFKKTFAISNSVRWFELEAAVDVFQLWIVWQGLCQQPLKFIR